MTRLMQTGRRRRALVAAASPPETTAEAVARVAAEQQEHMEGYGETAWHAERGVVLYVAGDWTDTDAVDAAFLTVDGVDAVEHEAEALPEGWWEAEVVYPENPPRWVVDRSVHELEETQAAVDEVLAELAATPPLDFRRALAAVPDSAMQDRDGLVAALETLDRAHSRHAEAVQGLVASAGRGRAAGAADGNGLAHDALAALHAFATRPAAAPPSIQIRTPDVRVDAPVTVTLPEQAAPQVDVHVAAPEAPVTHVHVPPGPLPVAPVVNVRLPDPAAAPVVNVDAHVHMPEPRPRAIRVAYDDTGERVFIPEELEELPETS